MRLPIAFFFTALSISSFLATSCAAFNPPSVFEPLGSHPYIPANATYAPAPAAYVNSQPGWPTAPWSLGVPSAYNTPFSMAVAPITIPGWRYADSPKYFRPGFGYVLPSQVFRAQSNFDYVRLGPNRPATVLEMPELWRSTTNDDQRSAPGTFDNSPFRFQW